MGFADMGQFLAVFTPRRWGGAGRVTRAGPLTVAELARRVKRDYKNVHGDVEKVAGMAKQW